VAGQRSNPVIVVCRRIVGPRCDETSKQLERLRRLLGLRSDDAEQGDGVELLWVELQYRRAQPFSSGPLAGAIQTRCVLKRLRQAWHTGVILRGAPARGVTLQ